jgi:hypothetical protein
VCSQRHGKVPLPKLTTAALIAFIGKALPKFLFNRGLYRLTKKKTAVLLSILMMLAWAWLSGNFQFSSSLEEESQARVEMD